MPRSRMILFSPLIALLASGSAASHGQEPGRGVEPRGNNPPAARPAQAGQARPQPVNDPVKMKWLLEKWEGQSAKLKSLDVKIYRIDKDPKWKAGGSLQGRAIFKSPNLAYLDFKKIKLAPNAKKGQTGRRRSIPRTANGSTTPTETIVCGPNEVWQYLYEGRQIFIYPLAKGERQRALDEGPYRSSST